MSKCLCHNFAVIQEVMTLKLVFVLQVVCSTCKHVSVTYEPFMYLSVPLPHAMERQMCKLNHCILIKLFIQKHFVTLDKMIDCLWVNCCVIINLINIFNVNLEDVILFLT
jgi:ubiquitin C-terminal hydrolase